MTADGSDILKDLQVSLRQTSKSPPAVAIKVTNKSPKPVTILTWESPLDELALQLGLLTLTPASSSTSLDLPSIKVSRKLPPGDESLASLAPGESVENHVVFKELLVPVEKMKGTKTKVALKGQWKKVWLKERSQLTQAEIEQFGTEGGAVVGDYEAEAIEVEVE